MPTVSEDLLRYRNPLLDFDVPDPDVIALESGGYALVASSFDRSPGLPLWHSDDLMHWRPVGHAGGFRADAPHDGGVWAPSIREHDGRIYVVWGDPDIGVMVVDAPALAGPWSAPRVLLAGHGLIDACPVWDESGHAKIVHGYARSRAGFANRVDVFDADSTLTTALSASRTVIDGDTVAGCSVLEGPKVYRRDGELWIFAPAGGVATGWQYAFRAPSWEGPWKHRIVLEQGDTAVNGPHQGAWVTGRGGEEWFAHFQAKGALGRVLHLQPLAWDAEGWPQIGDPEHPGRPVDTWPTPGGGTVAPPPAPAGDAFTDERLDASWHTRGTSIDELVSRVGDGSITLTAHPDAAVLRPLDGAHREITVRVLPGEGAGAAFVLSDAIVREIIVHPSSEVDIVEHTVDGPIARGISEHTETPTIGARVTGDRATFTLDGADVGEPFELSGRRWTGAEWGLAARGTGTAVFGAVAVSA